MSFRGRLVAAFVTLVALTAAGLGASSYLFVRRSLQERLAAEAVDQATFNLTELVPRTLPDRPTREDLEASRIDELFRTRGGAETVVDLGDEEPFVSGLAFVTALDAVSPELRQLVEDGHLGYQWTELEGIPYLVVGGPQPPDGPDFYFFFPAQDVETALTRLAQALVAGGAVLVVVAVLTGGLLARRVLGPVRLGSLAATHIAEGDLSARVPVESPDELGAWARSFNRMAAALEGKVAELQEAQARQRRFVADVSHELRTPLTALVNEAVMLRDHLGRMDADRRRLAELLVIDVTRLRDLVADLMELSRFDAASEELELVRFELRPFLDSVVASRLPGARLRLPAQAVVVRSDRRRLERILANLLDNARHHAGASEVEVAAQVHDGELVVTVADRGPGVDPQDLDHLFDRFYKSDPARSGGGSGLGLAIAREHARLMGGELTASLREEGGLVFELRLPVTHSLPEGDPAVTWPAEAADGY